jgi:hypothetical protein
LNSLHILPPAWLQDRFRDFTFDPVRFPVNAMREFVARCGVLSGVLMHSQPLSLVVATVATV